eukprot:1468625-Amphidinium_carterae.2
MDRRVEPFALTKWQLTPLHVAASEGATSAMAGRDCTTQQPRGKVIWPSSKPSWATATGLGRDGE